MKQVTIWPHGPNKVSRLLSLHTIHSVTTSSSSSSLATGLVLGVFSCICGVFSCICGVCELLQ